MKALVGFVPIQAIIHVGIFFGVCLVFSSGLISWHDVMNREWKNFVGQTLCRLHDTMIGPYTYIHTYGSSSSTVKNKKSAVRAASSLERNLFSGEFFFEVVVTLLRAGSRNLVTWVLTCAQRMNSKYTCISYLCIWWDTQLQIIVYMSPCRIVSPCKWECWTYFDTKIDSKPSLPLCPDIIPSIYLCAPRSPSSQHCDSLRAEV